ncbi:MAG: hypothetical protein AB1631_29735 [Acidobacteriota bacterium]
MKSEARGSIRNHTIRSNRSKSCSARSRSIARVLLVLLFFSMLLPAPRSIVPDGVMADPGDPVPGFGTNGVVFTDFAGGNDSAHGVATDILGRIIAAGSATIPGQGTDFALACYDRNGILDPLFGQGGKVTTDFFGGNDGAKGVAVQLDGKIVLSGFATNGSERQFAIVRFNPDGSLDTTFDQDGKVVLDLGFTSEAFKVALQADNKIVAVGDSRPQTSLDFTIIRLNQDGSPDNSFGNNGVVRVDFGFTDRAIDLAIDEENIFVCGIVVKSQTDSDMGIARLNRSNGSLNDDFNLNGKLTVDFFGKRDGAQTIQRYTGRLAAPPLNSRLLIGGFATPQTSDSTDFARVGVDFKGGVVNSIPKSFDFEGSTDQIFRLMDQPDGDTVGIGWAGDGANFNLGIAKWDPNGQLDSSWGIQGEYTFDTSSGGNNVAFDGMLYEDTIITAGTGLNPATGNDDFILTRHDNEKFFEFTKTVSPNPAVIGDIVTYTLTVKNLKDQTVVVDPLDTLPYVFEQGQNHHVTFDSDSNPNWTQPPDVFYVVHEPITLGGLETRQITLRLRANRAGLLRNTAYIYSHPLRDILARANVESEVTEPSITGAVIQGKKLLLFGSYGNSSDANLSGAIEPQAKCPVILIDGEEQKTKRDPDNPTTVLIAKKGGKKIARGQTVRLRVRLCNGIETADFIYTRPQ